jgi:hypothetical protein
LRIASSALLTGSALLGSSCASGPAGSESFADGSRSSEEKSVLLGELIAIFPGFFVHGLGHRYAENDDTASELMYLELYSVLTMGLGGALLALGDSQDAEAVEIAGWVGIGVGAVPFLGTWVYDIVYTPSEIRRHNDRIRPP